MDVRWDIYRKYLKPIIFLSDEYQSIIALETGINSFTSTLVFTRRTGELNILLDGLKHFPDLSDLIAKKRPERIWRQKYKQRTDMVELNSLINLIQKMIRDYRISGF